jgi:hypothetical protein
MELGWIILPVVLILYLLARSKSGGNMRPAETAFLECDEVVHARGPYQSTRGIFAQFRLDAHWADIMERNGRTRSRLLEWLAHSTDDTPGFATRRAQ